MKITLKFNHWLPKRLNVGAITLYPFVLFSCDKQTAVSSKMVNHEWIHVEQVRSLGWLRFYVSYLFHYALLLLKLRDRDKAYRAIPYEQQAYGNQYSFVLPQEALDTLSRS